MYIKQLLSTWSKAEKLVVFCLFVCFFFAIDAVHGQDSFLEKEDRTKLLFVLYVRTRLDCLRSYLLMWLLEL